jgi:phytoene/squalene synthetase
MKAIYDKLAFKIAKQTTNDYSTSFSLGIRLLGSDIRNSIYGIYGFVRLADEIVDSFHGYKQSEMLNRLTEDTYAAIEDKISTNPILHAFQKVVNDNHIPIELINQFLHSMKMDLEPQSYSQDKYEEYILGSAEVVGLMCLKVFLHGDEDKYQELKPSAMKLGSAFQKINFLRDLKDDYHTLGRTYFPNINIENFNSITKKEIEADIELDFEAGYEGIKKLPYNTRFGVYIAYVYYSGLLKKIKKLEPSVILNGRVRIPNAKKYGLFFKGYLRHSFNVL